jgi:hypothetical protein
MIHAINKNIDIHITIPLIILKIRIPIGYTLIYLNVTNIRARYSGRTSTL